MKMEVLSVQNQYQGQFGVIGSTKVKDWTSPLTPPPPPHTHNHPRRNSSSSNTHSATDVVDSPTHARQPLQPYAVNHHNAAMEAGSASIERSSSSRFTYNNNVLYCEQLEADVDGSTNDEDNIDSAAIQGLSQRLQAELRAAKSRHLACTEVNLPWDLTPRIAAEIIKTSEKEPCGVRGCSVFIEFADEPNNTRRIAAFKVDPNTVSTFELYLTLKHDKSGWTSLLPQFIKNLTRSSTILISPDFSLTKNKLYSCE